MIVISMLRSTHLLLRSERPSKGPFKARPESPRFSHGEVQTDKDELLPQNNFFPQSGIRNQSRGKLDQAKSADQLLFVVRGDFFHQHVGGEISAIIPRQLGRVIATNLEIIP